MRAVRKTVAIGSLEPQQRKKSLSGTASGAGRLPSGDSRIRQLAINTIRTLSIDAVERASSGHPGAPMGLAPVAYTLWQEFLQFDPEDPAWPNRDRFVLSNGHASMLLYSMLFLAGIKDGHGAPALTLEDIKQFRQIDSKTPGHPEHGRTAGVETTTGPLGQGCGNSVGMALAGKWLAFHFNRPNFPLFDYRVYTICGDGDMMEGVASEAASLAGHLRLGNLCWIYDNNRISIEGSTGLAFSDDVAARFKAYGWKVHHLEDANDTAGLASFLDKFRKTRDAPTLIVVDSHIGFGAPHKQDTGAAHGEPLGAHEVRLAKRSYGWPEDACFLVPDGVREHFAEGVGQRGRERSGSWRKLFEAYRGRFPDLAGRLDTIQRRELPDGWDCDIPTFPADPKGIATRESSGKVLNAIAAHCPWLVGGAADLAPSTKTHLKDADDLEAASPGGRNMHFGVREHAMGSILNGMALSGLRPFGATFLIFSDYMKPPIRLAALMELPVLYVFTHDSIGLGEDGPTHQPIEQLLALRSVPGLITLRPADANEVAEAYRVIARLKHNPAALALSRQSLPTFDRRRYAPASGVARGAYVLADSDGPEVILIGTGSEMRLCIEAYEKLKQEGVAARVVSMPSWELFEAQDEAYRNSVLPPKVIARVSVEMGSVIGWDRYVLPGGIAIGMHHFGASAPLKDLLVKFDLTTEAVLAAARAQVKNSRGQAP
jgi:transketolase